MEGEQQAADPSVRSKGFLRWPSEFLGPAPGLNELHLACWTLVIVFFILRFCIPVWIQFKAGKLSIPLVPDDFVYFYGIGHIVNNYPAARLYDYGLQLQVFNEIYKPPIRAYGPSPYPPFVAMFFSLFARVGFRLAFFLWMGCSLLLYGIGIVAAVKDFFPGERTKISLILCFAVAFYPFFWGIFVNGQITSVAVCSVGLAVYLERRTRLFESGLALSILAYKPTLLVLLIPMVLVTRRFKTLAGFATGGAVLVLIGTGFGGIAIWPEYAHFLRLFGQLTGMNGQTALLLYKFVDLNSFLQAIFGGRTTAATVILVSIIVAVTSTAAVLLWRSAGGSKAAQTLAWAATITWTLLLNVYVPMYDSVLIVIGAMLTLGAMRELKWGAAERWIVALSVLIFAVSWFSYDIAQAHRVQLVSLAFAVLGLAQLFLLFRVTALSKADEGATPAAA
jgi:hypothetical protein